MSRLTVSGRTAARFVTLSLLILGLSTACASTQSAHGQRADAAVTSRVKAKLAADPEVKAYEVDVDTLDGVVRLSGFVDNEVAKREAGELAGRTRGVRRVVNELQVGEKSLGESIDDASITARIQLKYTADSDLNPLNIDVDSEKGVVTLSGWVKSEAQREAAERIARETEGVRRVRNQLKVRQS